MDQRLLFGIFVFETNHKVIYRFLNDDLHEHLLECFKKKGLMNEETTVEHEVNSSFISFSCFAFNFWFKNDNDNELQSTFDDAIWQHLRTLVRIFEQTTARHDPIRRVKLNTGIQLFFDQIGDKYLICMADKSYETILVLKTINLFKALIKFHIGALPFTFVVV